LKTHFIKKKIKYDGSQLRSLFAYLDFKVQGDSVVSFRGPCDVSLDHMVDGEDLLEKAQICGSEMLHFVFEIFDRELVSGIFLQRLFAGLVNDEIYKRTKIKLRREGDDLYWDDKKSKSKKLSISIATKSPISVMVHFAINISNKGTPGPTCSLNDFKINPENFAKSLLSQIANEYSSILVARVKARPIG
jgi:uncharacterized protein